MGVELSDLVDSLAYTVSPPGTDLFPDATENIYVEYLRNGFWEAVLDRVITGYTEEDGLVTPVSGVEDLARELQQLVVIYAAITIVRTQIMNRSGSAFRAKAGPVEYEESVSSTMYRAVLDDLLARRQQIIDNLSSFSGSTSYYYDGVRERGCSIPYGYGFTGAG